MVTENWKREGYESEEAYYRAIADGVLERMQTAAMSLLALSGGKDTPCCCVIHPGCYEFVRGSGYEDWPELKWNAGYEETPSETGVEVNGLEIFVDRRVGSIGDLVVTDRACRDGSGWENAVLIDALPDDLPEDER